MRKTFYILANDVNTERKFEIKARNKSALKRKGGGGLKDTQFSFVWQKAQPFEG